MDKPIDFRAQEDTCKFESEGWQNSYPIGPSISLRRFSSHLLDPNPPTSQTCFFALQELVEALVLKCISHLIASVPTCVNPVASRSDRFNGLRY